MASETVSQDLQDGVSSAVAAFTRAVRNHVFLFFQLTENFLPLLQLVSIQESSKADVRRAIQGEREANKEKEDSRRERDALLAEKAAWRGELEAAKLEIERWKVVVRIVFGAIIPC